MEHNISSGLAQRLEQNEFNFEFHSPSLGRRQKTQISNLQHCNLCCYSASHFSAIFGALKLITLLRSTPKSWRERERDRWRSAEEEATKNISNIIAIIINTTQHTVSRWNEISFFSTFPSLVLRAGWKTFTWMSIRFTALRFHPRYREPSPVLKVILNPMFP